MKTIWKFPIEIAAPQSIQMPKGAEVLCVQTQAGDVCIWALVESTAELSNFRVDVVGTGHPALYSKRAYVGMFQVSMFVFHVFAWPEENK